MLTFWLSGNGYAQESTAKVQPRDESADVHENIKKDKNETLLIPQKVAKSSHFTKTYDVSQVTTEISSKSAIALVIAYRIVCWNI